MRILSVITTVALLSAACSGTGEYRSAGQKTQYDLINEVLSRYVFIPAGDGIRPSMYTGCVYRNMPGKLTPEHFVQLIENTGAPFTAEDKDYMKWQLEKGWNRKIRRSLIDSYNITVIGEKKSGFDNTCNSMLLYLSPPFFSLDRDYAIIWQSLEYKDLRAGFLLTLKKEKNRWELVSWFTE